MNLFCIEKLFSKNYKKQDILGIGGCFENEKKGEKPYEYDGNFNTSFGYCVFLDYIKGNK